MLRRLFSFRRKKETRRRWWQECDDRVCPVQLLCRDSDGAACDQSLSGRGHQCTATSVDDYEGVSWLERLERPEWPVPKHCFENRDEDLSVSSCVESIWSPRSRALSTAAGPAASVSGGGQWLVRAEDGARDAVMAKLGLQVTCLGSGSPMSKSYPGRKAVFSAHRGLSLYKSGGDAAAAAEKSLRVQQAPMKDGSSTPEAKPGAGDHRNLPNTETLDNKYRNRSVKLEDNQGEQRISSQQNPGLNADSAECANVMVYHAETAITSEGSICKHLEGLLEECQINYWKDSSKLDEGRTDTDSLYGSGNVSGVLHTSASSGDIKLDHIEDIGRRLHSIGNRQSGGGCGVEEDGRLQLGLGDFDHWSSDVPCNRHRRDASSHSEVTGSGDCKEGSGGHHLPSTSSPIPTEASGDELQFAADEAKATKEKHCNEDIIEAKTMRDDSFSSDVTLTKLSISDCIEEADFEVASQQSMELCDEFLDSYYAIETNDGMCGATLDDGPSVVRQYPDVAATHDVLQNELTATPREPRSSEWGHHDAFKAERGDCCIAAFEERTYPIGLVRKSASVSGGGFESVGPKFSGMEVSTVSAGSSPASRPTRFEYSFCDKELRQLCPSPVCSLDGQVSASSCDSFFTVASYDDDLCFQKGNQIGPAQNGDSSLGGSLPETDCPLLVGRPLRTGSQSFQSYEERTDSGCDIERDTDAVSASGEANDLSHDAETTLCRDGYSSSTTTLSLHVLDEQAKEASSTGTGSKSESSEEEEDSSGRNSPASLQSESPPSSPLARSSSESPTPSNTSNRATCSSSIASSPFSLPEYQIHRDSFHSLTDTNPESSCWARESLASDDNAMHVDSSDAYACGKVSTPSNMPNSATRSSSIEPPTFSLPDYRSCRDFLRNLTDANPELSHSLSESFASDERNIDLDTSVQDACRQIFSSYNESFTQFESVQNFAALPRFSTTEMLTCPELRPLRLSGCREDVFEPILSRDPSRRLKRQAMPTASNVEASTTIISENRAHVPSGSSVSMPDLKR